MRSAIVGLKKLDRNENTTRGVTRENSNRIFFNVINDNTKQTDTNILESL